MISFLALKRREIFPMRPPSSNWLKEIEVFRNRDSDDSYNIPIYPWLAPPLHPKIRSLIERWGVEKEVPANAPVLGHINERVDKLVLVKSGGQHEISVQLVLLNAPLSPFLSLGVLPAVI